MVDFKNIEFKDNKDHKSEAKQIWWSICRMTTNYTTNNKEKEYYFEIWAEIIKESLIAIRITS